MSGYFGDLSAMFGGTATPDQSQGGVGGTLGLAGIGLSAFGAIGASKAASAEAGLSADEAKQEQAINASKQQAMVLDANRKQIEIQRNTQRARSQGLAAAVSSGAQFGSGLAGGQAQAADQGAFNSLGVSQNLQIGQSIFAADSQISNDKIAMANAQSSGASSSALGSIGSSLVGAAGTLAKFAMVP